MFTVLHRFIHIIQPVLEPLCLIAAWTLIASLCWSFFSASRDAVAQAKKMHEVPCTDCQFFTNDSHLKCTVQPLIANTEEAINCRDYTQQRQLY
ncbi:MAG: hypothetical protein BRC40_03310 [Cyanobacteria bacterium QH_8_48_120]|nr:MAG: hypothetical protein BRC34_17525 [Cyanobacteria bacterium QH_1_48_107]PSO62653.1 MAG: hypothetical protein BRC38_15370 [Cyanobacteria bacterium QH_6_48_35]PSO76384.1 MAG: hypothetical protein BRC40_03310 [Cyanobacteria bacterium QH_8_48_120]PSO97374.1 MAG: hypothetical protein BRC48_04305 [Cyanobacteria bacterium QS_9_48_30]